MHLKKTTLVSILLFLQSILSAQEKDDFYIKQTGFSKIDLVSKKDTITFITSSKEVNKPKPTILFLQGSLALPIIFYDATGTSTLLPFNYKDYLDKFNFVIIQRYGVPLVGSYEKDTRGYLDKNGKTPEAYIKNDNLNYRTFQAATVLNYLYTQKWVQKDAIFVVGHSEGYRVAAKLSENNKKIAKLVCMSADPFNRITEEILRERVASFSQNNDSISQTHVEKNINYFKKIPVNIEQYKGDYNLYNWFSYNKELCFKSFQKFKNPILIVYGTDDIPATHNDLLPFLLPNCNITLKAYAGCDHNYFKKEFDKKGKALEDSYNWDIVFKDVQNWLLLKQ